MNKFFVELPHDEHGNRSYTNFIPAVLEIYVTGDIALAEIVAPKYHAEQFKAIPAYELYDHWLEVDGPARQVSADEREFLIVQKLRRAS